SKTNAPRGQRRGHQKARRVATPYAAAPSPARPNASRKRCCRRESVEEAGDGKRFQGAATGRGVGGTGVVAEAWRSAAAGWTIPQPYSRDQLPLDFAVCSISCLTCSGLSFGWRARMSAATPATKA